MKVTSKAGFRVKGRVRMKTGLDSQVKPFGKWSMRCIRGGEVVWQEDWTNIITTAGLNYLIDAGLSGGTQTTTWYVGLVNGATPTFAAGDTSASHAGWTEEQNYDEANRVTFTDAGPTAGAVTNSASPAQFTMSSAVTVGGAFLISNNTKGGTTGTLYAEGDFAVDRSVQDNDVLEVTATFGVADDGA